MTSGRTPYTNLNPIALAGPLAPSEGSSMVSQDAE